MNHPKRCVLCVCLALLTAALAAFPAAAAQKKKEEELPSPPVVIKYLGSQKMRLQGKEVLVVSGVTAMGGKQVTLPIPNKENKDKYNPDERMEEATKQLKPGDYAETQTKTSEYKTWLSEFKPYKIQPGEDQPNAFVYRDSYPQKNGDKEVQVVALYKFGNYVDTVLPTRRDETSRQMVTDPDMLATVGKLTKGDIVEAEVRPGNPPVIQSIDRYKPPVEAKMTKMTEADVAEGIKGPAVELDQGGKPLTLLIPGKMAGQKWVPDTKLAGLAKNTKPGTAVLVKTRDADGKTFLKEIKPAPKTPVASKDSSARDKEMEKEPAMKEKEKEKEKEPAKKGR